MSPVTLNSKEQAAFAKLAAGHGLAFPTTKQECQVIFRNQDGEVVVYRTLVGWPNRAYPYFISETGKITAAR